MDGSECVFTLCVSTGFIQMPQSVSAPLDSGSVEFNCSATVSLTFLVDGQNVSALPDSRGIASTISMMNDTVSGVVSVSVIEENNNTEVLCRLTNGELQSTSLPALLTITDTECKLANMKLSYSRYVDHKTLLS